MRLDYMHIVALIFFAVVALVALDAYLTARIWLEIPFTFDLEGALGRLLFDIFIISVFAELGFLAWSKANQQFG